MLVGFHLQCYRREHDEGNGEVEGVYIYILLELHGVFVVLPWTVVVLFWGVGNVHAGCKVGQNVSLILLSFSLSLCIILKDLLVNIIHHPVGNAMLYIHNPYIFVGVAA